MITKRIVIILALLALAVPASQARAAMTIWNYQPKKHDRFYSAPDRAFIGEAYDWSGVGWSSGEYPGGEPTPGRSDWATMISPQYFLAARHAKPEFGEDVTFYEGNTRTPAESHTYEVDSWSRNWGDLYLGRLTQPISANIAYYPILELPSNEGNANKNKIFFAYGRTDRVGRNKIDEVRDETAGGFTTRTMKYDYDHGTVGGGVGDDENLLESGDSGGPSFIDEGGELALIGAHWLRWGSNPDPGEGIASSDSFVPHYIDFLHPYVNGGDANKDGNVNDIDATILAANWGQTGATWGQGDFSGDTLVNSIDADYLTANWQRPTTWLRSQDMSNPGASASASASVVPEPTTAILLLIGSLSTAALHFRRRACSR